MYERRYKDRNPKEAKKTASDSFFSLQRAENPREIGETVLPSVGTRFGRTASQLLAKSPSFERLSGGEIEAQGRSDSGIVQRESVEGASEASQPNQTGLPDRLKTGIENMSGFDLSGVRVNYNSPKPAQVNAHAYTQGKAIEVAPRQEQHLPHEAWHVVQQMQGRVRPTTEINGHSVNDDRHLEQEADVMGRRAMQ
ncbi:MAG: DUF4157 domain-containing protein [Cyanobacteria bacterium P01_E01_bin.42]